MAKTKLGREADAAGCLWKEEENYRLEVAGVVLVTGGCG
jgi:hypothetical protein